MQHSRGLEDKKDLPVVIPAGLLYGVEESGCYRRIISRLISEMLWAPHMDMVSDSSD